MARDRKSAERRGRRAETLAAMSLILKGYRILDQRAKTPVGEIDIIAAKGNILAFVEVKRRHRLDDAKASITVRNQHRIVRAAQWWMARRRQSQKIIRFDAICVASWWRMTHIRSAWQAPTVR